MVEGAVLAAVAVVRNTARDGVEASLWWGVGSGSRSRRRARRPRTERLDVLGVIERAVGSALAMILNTARRVTETRGRSRRRSAGHFHLITRATGV